MMNQLHQMRSEILLIELKDFYKSRCQICLSNKDLQIYHLNTGAFGCSKMMDVLLLCGDCTKRMTDEGKSKWPEYQNQCKGEDDRCLPDDGVLWYYKNEFNKRKEWFNKAMSSFIWKHKLSSYLNGKLCEACNHAEVILLPIAKSQPITQGNFRIATLTLCQRCVNLSSEFKDNNSESNQIVRSKMIQYIKDLINFD